MAAYTHAASAILVASDGADDGESVKKLLDGEFAKVVLCADPGRLAEDYDHRPPDVLVLAFDKLEKTLRHYLELLHLGSAVHVQPHRAIVLCRKEEIHLGYRLCRDGLFGNYVQFWPATDAALRLPMTVHNALCELAALKSGWPAAGELTAQVCRLTARLEPLLRRPVANAAEPPASASSMPEEDGPAVPDLSLLPLRAASVPAPTDTRPRFGRPTILLVDDDEFQHKIVNTILGDNYRLIFAAGGREALQILQHKAQPDLILMDIMMPDLDGLTVTRQIRTEPRFADTPIVIITGKREKNIVIDSLKAGATGFVVKPFDRDTLRNKVAQLLPAA